jgi:hypothetical protein
MDPVNHSDPSGRTALLETYAVAGMGLTVAAAALTLFAKKAEPMILVDDFPPRVDEWMNDPYIQNDCAKWIEKLMGCNRFAQPARGLCKGGMIAALAICVAVQDMRF